MLYTNEYDVDTNSFIFDIDQTLSNCKIVNENNSNLDELEFQQDERSLIFLFSGWYPFDLQMLQQILLLAKIYTSLKFVFINYVDPSKVTKIKSKEIEMTFRTLPILFIRDKNKIEFVAKGDNIFLNKIVEILEEWSGEKETN
jgi:hypothetical protein